MKITDIKIKGIGEETRGKLKEIRPKYLKLQNQDTESLFDQNQEKARCRANITIPIRIGEDLSKMILTDQGLTKNPR